MDEIAGLYADIRQLNETPCLKMDLRNLLVLYENLSEEITTVLLNPGSGRPWNRANLRRMSAVVSLRVKSLLSSAIKTPAARTLTVLLRHKIYQKIMVARGLCLH